MPGNAQNVKHVERTDAGTIIGRWTQVEEDGAQCNVCPTVVFKGDFSGCTNYANSTRRFFNWRVDSCLEIIQNCYKQ